MSIDLLFFKPIISMKIFNHESKSNPLISNILSCFKVFSKFKHFSFQIVQSSDFNFLILNKKSTIFSYILNCLNLL